MSEHGHASGGHEKSHGNKSEESALERIPYLGKFVSMLKTIASVDGLKSFLDTMIKDHIYPVIMKLPDAFIGVFFGAEGGGGGSHAHAH